MEVEIGKVTHYFDHIHVAVLMLKGMLRTGDKIHVHGHTEDFTQLVTSLEINHANVLWAQPGDNVALQVIGPVHVNDKVYRIAEKKMIPQPV